MRLGENLHLTSLKGSGSLVFDMGWPGWPWMLAIVSRAKRIATPLTSLCLRNSQRSTPCVCDCLNNPMRSEPRLATSPLRTRCQYHTIIVSFMTEFSISALTSAHRRAQPVAVVVANHSSSSTVVWESTSSRSGASRASRQSRLGVEVGVGVGFQHDVAAATKLWVSTTTRHANPQHSHARMPTPTHARTHTRTPPLRWSVAEL